MSPLQLAIDKVGRAVASFHPRTLPLLLRAHYGRELGAWCLLPLMLGALEGGVVAVIAKTVFSASVHTRWLNLAVAILVGAPAFANVVSFLWAITALAAGCQTDPNDVSFYAIRHSLSPELQAMNETPDDVTRNIAVGSFIHRLQFRETAKTKRS